MLAQYSFSRRRKIILITGFGEFIICAHETGIKKLKKVYLLKLITDNDKIAEVIKLVMTIKRSTSLVLFFFNLVLHYACVCCAYVCVCAPHACLVPVETRERTSDDLDLEFVVNCPVGGC